MSTLSGIISAGAGVALSQLISQRPEVYGQVANVGTQQYVRTGWLAPYESRHSTLTSQFKPLGVVTGMAFNNTFSFTGTSAYVAGVVSNANYLHAVAVGPAPGFGTTNVRWTANATGGIVNSNAAAITTNTTLTAPTGSTGGYGTTDAINFKGNVYIAGYNYNISAGGYTSVIWTSNTGSTYTLVNNVSSTGYGGYAYPVAMSANATTIIVANFLQNASSSGQGPDMWVSTDGVTWTARATNMSSVYPAKFFWNPLLNVWTVISTTGAIYTSPDATTFTLRTSPSGMPTTISTTPTAWGMVANTANATYVSLTAGNPFSAAHTGQILKITGLTSYSILSYENEYNARSAFSLYYDGTRLIRIPFGGGTIGVNGGTAAIYTSTDDGATWTKGYTLCGLIANNNANTVSSGNTGFFNPTNAFIISGISKSGPNNNVFASMSGIYSANNGHTTIPTDTNNYYLVDITNVATQVNPDYVGMPYPSNPGNFLTGYVRTV